MSHRPIRTCLVCSRKEEKRKLIRMTLREGRLMLDQRGVLGGRGAYICRDVGCVKGLLTKKGAERLKKVLRGSFEEGELLRVAEELRALCGG